MRKAGVWAVYDADVKTAWDVLTSREDVSWRSDLSKIEYRPGNRDYVEHSHDGYQLGFVVTEERPYEYYEIETWSLETKGKRSFEFEDMEDGTTRVILREEMKIKPFWIEWLSRFFMPLEKLLTQHLEDARGYIEYGKDETIRRIAKDDAEKARRMRDAEGPVPREHQLYDDDMPTEEELAIYDTDYLNDENSKSKAQAARKKK